MCETTEYLTIPFLTNIILSEARKNDVFRNVIFNPVTNRFGNVIISTAVDDKPIIEIYGETRGPYRQVTTVIVHSPAARKVFLTAIETIEKTFETKLANKIAVVLEMEHL
jgi:hypothetical protein